MKGYAEAEGEEVPEAPDRWAHAAKESLHRGLAFLGGGSLQGRHGRGEGEDVGGGVL